MYYGMYLLSIPFGYQDWYGRLINLIVSSLGLYFFFLLVQRFFTERVAFYATLILTTSLWLIFSRKTMQDTFAVSLVFMGLYCSFQYFDRGRWGPLMCYIVLTTLGILSKIPAGMYLLFPILYLIRNPVPRKRMVGWGIGTLAPLILSYLWYFVYAPYASERYGYWHNLGEPLRDGLRSLVQNMDHVAENFFFQSFHSFVFIGALLMYWVMIIRRKERKHLIAFVSFTLVFAVFMIRSGTYFVQHNYYMIPYIPVMAVMIAKVLTKVPNRKWSVFLLVLGMAEGVVWVARDFTDSPREVYKMNLTEIVRNYSSPDDRIVLVNNGNPIGFYFAHRKGWLQANEEPLSMDKIKEVSGKGARILIVNRHVRRATYNLPILYEDEDYRIYELGKYPGRFGLVD